MYWSVYWSWTCWVKACLFATCNHLGRKVELPAWGRTARGRNIKPGSAPFLPVLFPFDFFTAVGDDPDHQLRRGALVLKDAHLELGWIDIVDQFRGRIARQPVTQHPIMSGRCELQHQGGILAQPGLGQQLRPWLQL